MILPWTGCATRRSTRTTTVLSVLSETTVPVRTRLGMCSSSSLGLGGARPFVLQRLDLRDGAADLADAARLFKLVSRSLETPVELLALPIGKLRLQLVCALHLAIGDLCHGRSEENTSELQSLLRSSYAVF